MTKFIFFAIVIIVVLTVGLIKDPMNDGERLFKNKRFPELALYLSFSQLVLFVITIEIYGITIASAVTLTSTFVLVWLLFEMSKVLHKLENKIVKKIENKKEV